MRRRNAGIALVLAVAAVGIVLFVYPLRTEAPPTAIPSASAIATATAAPSATLTATTPSAASSATAPATASAGAGRYGYIAIGGGGFALVDETGTTIQQHACGVPGRGCGQGFVAVSPDGRRVGFWRAGQGSRWELATLETASPASVRAVFTLPEGMEGQTIAWATDSRGLLFAAQTTGYGGIQGGQGKATISGIDGTTPGPATDMLPARTDGAFYVPVAWDRAKSIVAAVTSGEGGFLFEYVVKVGGGQPSVTRGTAGQLSAFQVTASPDATRVLAIDGGANVLRIWPVTDFRTQVEIKPGPGGRINGALWRTPNDVAWSYGDRLDVFIPQSDSSRTVYTAPGVRLVAMRSDGTAALVASGGQVNVSTGLVVVEIPSGAVLSRTTMDIAQVVIPRGVLR